MPVEIQLPDLPEIAIGGSPRPPMPWHLRLRDTLSTYLPLLLMALLAAATWWLVKSTPGAPPERRTQVPPGVADYAMQRFVLQRYAPDGRLTAQLEGRELRHYPENDRIEVDELQLRAWSADGRLITATARRAVSNGAASELQLQGGAEVIGLDADGTPVQIRSEFLQATIETQVVSTSQPVEMKHGGSLVRAAGLHYDGRQRLLEFKGPVRASLQAGR